MAKQVNKGDKHLRADEIMPSYAQKEMLDLLEVDQDGLFRKSIAWKMIHKKPALGKHIANGIVPFNLLFRKDILKKITEDMPLKEQRKLLKSAKVDVTGLCFINLNKISGIKRTIERKAGKVVFTSSRHSGVQLIKYASHDNIAKKMYDILSYNAGQLKIWHEHAERFNKKCGDKKLVKRIKLYSKLAMDENVLPDLRDDVKVYTETI